MVVHISWGIVDILLGSKVMGEKGKELYGVTNPSIIMES
jgi:hypothetical protein